MDLNVLHLIVAGVLTLVFVVITALIWSRAQVKTVFWWIGLTLIPLGLYFLGLGPQVEGAWHTLSAWVAGLQLTPMIWVGIVLAALSGVLMLGSRLIPSESYKDRRAAAKASREKKPVGAGGRPAVASRPPAAAPTSAPARPADAPKGQAAGGDGEFDEIADLLRKRGIN